MNYTGTVSENCRRRSSAHHFLCMASSLVESNKTLAVQKLFTCAFRFFSFTQKWRIIKERAARVPTLFHYNV